MALYLTRYLTPPARVPGEDSLLFDDLPAHNGGDPDRPARRVSTARDRLILRQGSWRGISNSAIRHRHSSPPSRMRCCRKTLASTPTRCWRPGSGDLPSGATPTRAGIFSLRSPVCRRPFADGARGAADGRHCPAPDAGRRAASECRSVLTRPAATDAPRDAALVDGENLDLVAARKDNIACGFADQSPRDGGDVRN